MIHPSKRVNGRVNVGSQDTLKQKFVFEFLVVDYEKQLKIDAVLIAVDLSQLRNRPGISVSHDPLLDRRRLVGR